MTAHAGARESAVAIQPLNAENFCISVWEQATKLIAVKTDSMSAREIIPTTARKTGYATAKKMAVPNLASAASAANLVLTNTADICRHH